MADLLQEELTGAPVTVTIVGKSYPVALTMAASIAYKQATGRSIFDAEETRNLSLLVDPGRWLSFLWAVLHQEDAEGNWGAPFTLSQLKGMKIAKLDLAEIDGALWRVLRADVPKKDADPVPNAAAPADENPAAPIASPASTGSTRAPVVVLDSVVASS